MRTETFAARVGLHSVLCVVGLSLLVCSRGEPGYAFDDDELPVSYVMDVTAHRANTLVYHLVSYGACELLARGVNVSCAPACACRGNACLAPSSLSAVVVVLFRVDEGRAPERCRSSLWYRLSLTNVGIHSSALAWCYIMLPLLH